MAIPVFVLGEPAQPPGKVVHIDLTVPRKAGVFPGDGIRHQWVEGDDVGDAVVLDKAAVDQLVQQHKILQLRQVEKQLRLHPLHREKGHVFQDRHLLRGEPAQVKDLLHDLHHVVHHHPGAALGRPPGAAEIVQHGGGEKVGCLHLLGQQLDAVGVEADAAEHLHQRRLLPGQQGPFVKLPEQGQLILPPVHGADGQLLVPVLFTADAGGDDHGVPPLQQLGEPGVLGVQVVHHQQGVPAAVLFEVVQLFFVVGLSGLRSGQILPLALQAADVKELVRDEHLLDVRIAGHPHHGGVLAPESAQILPGQLAFPHSARSKEEELVVLPPEQPVHLLQLRLPAHKVGVAGQDGASDLPGQQPAAALPVRSVPLLFLQPVGDAGDQGGDPLLLGRVGAVQAVDAPEIVFHIVGHALLVGAEGEQADVLPVVEPVEGTVDLIEHMCRVGGVPVHDQQKDSALVNGAHDVSGILGRHVPGRVPALDAVALQRLDDALHKLGRGVVVITDKDKMFHRIPPNMNRSRTSARPPAERSGWRLARTPRLPAALFHRQEDPDVLAVLLPLLLREVAIGHQVSVDPPGGVLAPAVLRPAEGPVVEPMIPAPANMLQLRQQLHGLRGSPSPDAGSPMAASISSRTRW